MSRIPIIDVFAGPGGLNEGFSALDDGNAFSTVASVEMDPVACRTLRLRAAVRASRRAVTRIPPIYFDFMAGSITLDELTASPEFAPFWKEAGDEVHQHELAESTRVESDRLIDDALARAANHGGRWVLIGGPPCQAYSLAGRSRRKHDVTFAEDHKHTLYREYLNIIAQFRPHVFVMENVKGMLSSRHDGGRIFGRVMDDLARPGYVLRSFVIPGAGNELEPSDFIIRAERYGIPQTRHRVIILGVRSDVAAKDPMRVLEAQTPVSIYDAINDLPRIRSGLNPRSQDSVDAWKLAYAHGSALAGELKLPSRVYGLGVPYDQTYRSRVAGRLGEWLRNDAPDGIAQHTSRRHMPSDLARYAYLAHRALTGSRPRVHELPEELIPLHANARREDAPFADRFRVQVKHLPSSTITSHIAKDGHYYIHFDPKQMRSLSVREAARLQTFPDNYFFMGNRSQQYHQVGNAVPPLLAVQLARIVKGILDGS